MPWNCLCSSKEKRKLEISAPILNIDETSALQLISTLKAKPIVVCAGQQQTKQKRFDEKQTKNQKQKSSLFSSSNNNNGRINSNTGDAKKPTSNVSKKEPKGQKTKLDGVKQDVKPDVVTKNGKFKKNPIKKNDDAKVANIKKAKRVGSNKLDDNYNVNVRTEESTTLVGKKLKKCKKDFDSKSDSGIDGVNKKKNGNQRDDNVAATMVTGHTQVKHQSLPSVRFSFEGPSGTSEQQEQQDGGMQPQKSIAGIEIFPIPQICISHQEGVILTHDSKPDECQNKSNITTQRSQVVEEQLLDNAGNYDEIPSAYGSNTSQMENALLHEMTHTNPNNSHNRLQDVDFAPSSSSNVATNEYHEPDALEFIDDELHLLLEPPESHHELEDGELQTCCASKTSHVNDHNARYITLHPQNVGSYQTVIANRKYHRHSISPLFNRKNNSNNNNTNNSSSKNNNTINSSSLNNSSSGNVSAITIINNPLGSAMNSSASTSSLSRSSQCNISRTPDAQQHNNNTMSQTAEEHKQEEQQHNNKNAFDAASNANQRNTNLNSNTMSNTNTSALVDTLNGNILMIHNNRLVQLSESPMASAFIDKETSQQQQHLLLRQQYNRNKHVQQYLHQYEPLYQAPILLHGQQILPPVEHNFQPHQLVKGKLCQFCHVSLLSRRDNCAVVRCDGCELIIHSTCASLMPSIRYHDTSYIINKKWQRGGEELTFPLVHSFVNSDAKIRGYIPDTPDPTTQHGSDHYATDSETVDKQRQRHNYKDRPRRRTRSLEKRGGKRQLSAALEIHTTSDEEDDDDDDMDEDEVDGDIQSVKSVIEKKTASTKESQISNGPKIIDSNSNSKINNKENSNDGASKETKTETKDCLSDKNNNNKITITVQYQTITSNENLNLIDPSQAQAANKCEEHPNVAAGSCNQAASPVPQIRVREPSDDSVKRHSENPSVNSSVTTTTTTTSEDQQTHAQSVVVAADVHPRPTSIASSTISSDALIIRENSSDDETEGEYDLTKEIQHVPEFFKHRGSKSLITIKETVDPSQSAELGMEGSVSDQEDIERRKRNRISSNASDYDSDRTLMSDKALPFGIRKYFNGPGAIPGAGTTTASCTSPSWLSTSRSTLNDGDADYSMSDYEVVDLRRTGSLTSPIRNQTRHQSLQKSYTDHDIRLDHNNIPKSQSFPVHTKRRQYQSQTNIADNLRLHYVTQRILASILPAREQTIDEDVLLQGPHMEGQLQDEYEKEVIMMLEQKHGKNYRVFDLESCISVITLERICELCKRIDKWLGSGQDKVVVLQDRDNRQRLGATIAAYLEYLDICASSMSTAPRSNSRNSNRTSQGSTSTNEDMRAQNAINRNWLDLDIFSMKKFLEDFIGPLRIPSHRRYIQYFSGLLSGKVKMNSAALNLKCISIESPPSWLQYNGISSESEWNSFIKIYEGLRCIYTSDIHIIPITTRQFLYQTGNLQLRGDILIRCYQIVPPSVACNSNGSVIYDGAPVDNTECRELLFSLQFHTCAMDSKEVVFRKDDLDYAWSDHRFPKDCKVTFHFNRGANNSDNSYLFQSPLIRTEPPNILAKADSIEDFDLSSKYQGPLDGSLYATILKSPKTNTSLSSSHNQSASQSQLNRSSNSAVHLIQPPPQFSNHRQSYEIIESRPLSTSTPIRERGRTVEPPIRSSSLHIRDTQSQPRSTSDYSYIDSRPGTSQSNYRNHPSHQQQQKHQHQTQQITTVETYHNQHQQQSNNNNHLKPNSAGQSQQQNGSASTREYVRSPLTLSMDSGISSNGVLNRPQQGSSVSPISFPSQPSPQEDRHRELDEILSDMLMTVQDIPDFGKSKANQNQSTTTKTTQIQRQVRSQSAAPIRNQHHHHSTSHITIIPDPNLTNNNYHHHQQHQLKRSLSYNPYGNEPLISHQNPNQSAYLTKERLDLYGDTSSTATTLTPPPSENGGRDTPTTIASNIVSAASTTGSVSHQHPSNNYQQQQQIYRERRETYNSMASSSSQQSSLYRQQDRTYANSNHNNHNQHQQVVNCVSEEEDNTIPYHAREDSQPFSYGSVPNGHKLNELPPGTSNQSQNDNLDSDAELIDPKMIKAQSGLSSPSLVRKFAGGVNTQQSANSNGYGPNGTLQRKTPVRNEFEDMLRERREKVMSEKYSTIQNTSDTRNQMPSKVNDNGNKWLHTQVNQTNGYHYYNEPMKRCNTMDGFHRSNSTDGLSGQTWLQLQQQKLRAKKDQQLRDERKYFEDIHTEIRNRPQKSRVVRYDGYASDTAAFGDEVDYRRPLHVQTPINANRSPERKYNTITTTTTTVTKERPFVAVKRAHEQAKRENIGSPPISPLSALNASPVGHIVQVQSNQNQSLNQSQNGLLSMAESKQNGHARLESDIYFANDNDNTVARSRTNVINNNGINKDRLTIDDDDNTSTNSHDIQTKSIIFNNTTTLSNKPIHNHSKVNDQTADINQKTNGNIIFSDNCYLYDNDMANNNSYKNNYNIEESNRYQGPTTTSVANSKTATTTTNNCIDNSTKVNGQLALDRLLASLAIETDLMNRELAKNYSNNNNNSNNNSNSNRNNNKMNSYDSYKQDTIRVDHFNNNQFVPQKLVINDSNHNSCLDTKRLHILNDNDDRTIAYDIATTTTMSKQTTKLSVKEQIKLEKVQELHNVIAELTEFEHYETMRQNMMLSDEEAPVPVQHHHHGHNDSLQTHQISSISNNNKGGGCGSSPIASADSLSNNSSSNSARNSNSNNSNCSLNGIPRRLIASESEHSSSISPSLSERSTHALWTDQVREESFSSYRSETDAELSHAGSPRPETPAFPTTPRTPYGFSNGSVSPALPPKSPTSQRKDLFAQRGGGPQEIINQNEIYSTYGHRRNSNSSNPNSEPQEVAAQHVKFVRDSSKYWYKPSLSRDEAISVLRHAMPGTFLVRDSTTYKNAFGLVLRVAYPPPGVTLKPGGDELVRHFLIEPTSLGVRLKGCSNEPTFTSLSALIYQHSITPLALPCRLILPERDIAPTDVQSPAQKQLSTQGAACNVLYLYACETESLTGEEAVRRAISELYSLKPLPLPTEVHFKVSQQGITLTDVTRQKFFRKHYASNIVSFCGFDPDRRSWSIKGDGDFPVQNKTIFAFVARRSASSTDNQCHVFCDFTPNQPASAIVSFVNKVLPTEKLVSGNI